MNNLDEDVLTPYEAMSLAIQFFPENHIRCFDKKLRENQIQEVCEIAKIILYQANCTFNPSDPEDEC